MGSKKEELLNKIAISAASSLTVQLFLKSTLKLIYHSISLKINLSIWVIKKQDASESTLKLALAKLKFQIEACCAFGLQGGWTPLEV